MNQKVLNSVLDFFGQCDEADRIRANGDLPAAEKILADLKPRIDRFNNWGTYSQRKDLVAVATKRIF